MRRKRFILYIYIYTGYNSTNNNLVSKKNKRLKLNCGILAGQRKLQINNINLI